MILKGKILPIRIQDIVCCTSVLFCFIPFTYWFELYIVIPYFYSYWSVFYIFYWILSHFVTFNIVSNFMAIVMCDTSIKGKIMPTNPDPNWRFCSMCECFTPPRSWHCNSCRTCILKRDHHCLFTGCCIGHNNYRYFFIFLAYTVVALIISNIFNTIYVYQTIDMSGLYWLGIIFPLAMLVFDTSFMQFTLFMYIVSIVVTGILLVIFIIHLGSVKNNQTFAERGFNISTYDIGLMNNIKSIFGKRWYLTWICPFIESELIQDGINWQTTETEKNK